MNLKLSLSFYPLLEDTHRYLVLAGGKGSGKSEFAARKLFFRCLNEGGHRFLILRKVRKTAHQSTLEVFRRLLSEMEIEYAHDKTHQIISFPGVNGKMNELLFDGLDEPEKIKSIKALTGVWIEEATEFTERDFLEVDLSLREPTEFYKQIILSFNPDESLAPWLKKRFFPDDAAKADPRALTHGSTIEDNPIDEMREKYLEDLDAIPDETLRSIYRYGLWARPKGHIYDWPVIDALPWPRPDEVIYGLDFGYTVNPAVVARVYLKADELVVEEVLYHDPVKEKVKLVNKDIAIRMGAEGIGRFDDIYGDSAEPKSIQEIHDMGFNIKPCEKGPDSVRAGIGFLKSKKISILRNSPNIIKEVSTYKWKEDKDGNALPEPVKFNDHAMDAIRYAIFTHCKRPVAVARTIGHSVYPD